MKKLYLTLFAVALLSTGFWLYTGPQRALRDIKAAADSGDVEGVREHVDVSAVKESLKEQLGTMMQKKLAEDKDMQDNPFAGLGMMFASKMVDGMVDQAVTPTNLVALIQGDRAKAFAKNSDGAPAQKQEDGKSWEDKADISGSYDSDSRYTVRVSNKETHKQAVALTMRREGLTWKLAAVQLPLDEKEEVD